MQPYKVVYKRVKGASKLLLRIFSLMQGQNMLPNKLLYKSLFSHLLLKMERIEIQQICLLEYHEQAVDLSACKHFCSNSTVSRPFRAKTHVEEGGNGTVYIYIVLFLILGQFCMFPFRKWNKSKLEMHSCLHFQHTQAKRKTPRLMET